MTYSQDMFGVDSFMCTLSDGSTRVELVDGGSAVKLTPINRKEFIKLYLQKRLSEVQTQMDAFTKVFSIFHTSFSVFFFFFKFFFLIFFFFFWAYLTR